MGTDRIHQWESGRESGPAAPAGSELVPWYVEPVPDLREADDSHAGTAPSQPSTSAGRSIPAPRRSGAGPRSADDVHGQIKGFASTGAVAPGEALDFRITVSPPQQYGVDVYRIGDYGGHGAAKITSSPRLSGIAQPAPLAAGRTVSCHHWWLSWRLQVPADWNPGAYVAVLTTADGYRSHIPFTVRHPVPTGGPPAPDDGTPLPDLLLVLPDLSWQAHNAYPDDGRTGAGLHRAWGEDGRLLGEDDAASTVSFDRPYAGNGLPPQAAPAYDVIRWAEAVGYDLAYADARDLHVGRVDPSRFRGLLFPGRDEYWTEPMRRAVEHARDAGTSLVFLSAGALQRQVELAASPSGEPDRLLSRNTRRGPGGRPATWRDVGEPEQLLLGLQHTGPVPSPRPLVVRNADQWFWQGTGCADGDELPDLVAGAADRYHPRTPLPEHRGRILLSHSPYEDETGALRHQETSLYRTPGGAFVFASGTSGWCAALGRRGHTDERVQRATAQLLDRICKRG